MSGKETSKIVPKNFNFLSTQWVRSGAKSLVPLIISTTEMSFLAQKVQILSQTCSCLVTCGKSRPALLRTLPRLRISTPPQRATGKTLVTAAPSLQEMSPHPSATGQHGKLGLCGQHLFFYKIWRTSLYCKDHGISNSKLKRPTDTRTSRWCQYRSVIDEYKYAFTAPQNGTNTTQVQTGQEYTVPLQPAMVPMLNSLIKQDHIKPAVSSHLQNIYPHRLPIPSRTRHYQTASPWDVSYTPDMTLELNHFGHIRTKVASFLGFYSDSPPPSIYMVPSVDETPVRSHPSTDEIPRSAN